MEGNAPAISITLPPTCRNATRNDTCLLHPILAQRMVAANVLQDFEFDSHAPLFIEFDFSIPVYKPLVWDIPQSWKDMCINPVNFENAYHQQSQFLHQQIDNIHTEQDGQRVLEAWSLSCEKAVDQALRTQHKLDPLRNPLPNLPKSAFGRCRHRSLKQISLQRGVRGDKFGGYNPPNECFSVTNRHKIRQIRRLKSYHRTRTAIHTRGDLWGFEHPQWQQLQSEWIAICGGRGYGHSWAHWILGFEQIAIVPMDSPDISTLDIMIAITQVDCDASCRQEAYQKKKRFQFAVQIDNAENFGTMTYKIMKNKTTPKLEEVPYQISQWAVLCRSSKGNTTLRLQELTHFGTNQKALFGDSEIFIREQKGFELDIIVIQGVIPTQGKVVQHRITTTPGELFNEFANFWKPFWLRDQPQEQFQEDSWQDFVDEMNAANLPDMSLQVRIDDVHLWKKSIAKLRNNKSEGICGWRHEELKSLPDLAVEHLCAIFVKIWPIGLTCDMMQARTILLSKVAKPENINHGRPITILCTIYRLAAKVVFDQVVSQWASVLPHQISGGLPCRSVRDLSLMQTSHIEECIAHNQEICGTSMDLIKAFNLVPRMPASMLLRRLGISPNILVFWSICLSKMTRLPFAFNQLGEPIPSTTGVPEGDAWSVLCMLGISTMFFFRVRTLYTMPFAYADNWAWITRSIREQIRSWIRTLNMVFSMRMAIDPHKSWVWGTSTQLRLENKDIALLFPAENFSIEVHTHVKDLGEIVQYNRQLYNAPLRERLKETQNRIKRLKNLPISIQEKAHKIQTGAWTYGMYGVDTHYVGPHHFNKLRRAALEAFIGNKPHGSAWIAINLLSKYIMDPLLFVILSICRLVRRCYTYHPDIARVIVQRASSFTGKRAFGPATSFRKYLDHLNWTITPDGYISGQGLRSSTNCLQSPIKELVRDIKEAFGIFVYQQVSHRKGLTQVTWDIPSTTEVFSSFHSDEEQAILANHILGGFQNEVKKSKWDDESNNLCLLCNQVDVRRHRFLDCKHFENLRNQHKEAIHILEYHRANWVYHPVAYQSEDTKLIQSVLQTIPPVETIKEVEFSTTHHRYFTDGACAHPTIPSIRRSAWAVVQDLSENQEDRDKQASFVSPVTWQVPNFKTVVTGFTHGTQSPARAELLALMHACEHAMASISCESAEFVVDAQYVINVVSKINNPNTPWHKIANTDVVRHLQSLWNKKNFTISKIKSHRALHEANSLSDLWNLLGNHYADKAAGKALENIPTDFKNLILKVQALRQKEKSMLQTVLRYFCALDKARTALIKETKKIAHAEQESTQQDNSLFGDAIMKLSTYQVETGYNYIDGILQPQYANANLQGSGIAYAVWWWAGQLTWPSPDPVSGALPPVAKWGITWFELLVNFIISTGWYPPLRISGMGSSSVYVPYMSEEGLMQMPSKRAASHMTSAFQSLVQCVQSLS